ncbi:MAG: YitT family protein [Clostridia bacterium]|nr:YitT family protein [Clostridia bacterium]
MGEKIDANIQVKKKVSVKKELLSLFLLTVSAAIYAFNLKSFIRAGSLVPGGFSGLAVLIQTVFKRFLSVELPYSLIYLPLNAIPAYICLISVGKRFTLYSIYHIVVSSLLTDIIPKVPITSDILLICDTSLNILNNLK